MLIPTALPAHVWISQVYNSPPSKKGGSHTRYCQLNIRRTIDPIEGLGGSHTLQKAFVKHGGAQCGICTPGMIMAAVALGPKPSAAEMRDGLAGNLCRCTGYSAIYRSIRAAGESRHRGVRNRKGRPSGRPSRSGAKKR